jgi:hypothetical protein
MARAGRNVVKVVCAAAKPKLMGFTAVIHRDVVEIKVVCFVVNFKLLSFNQLAWISFINRMELS